MLASRLRNLGALQTPEIPLCLFESLATLRYFIGPAAEGVATVVSSCPAFKPPRLLVSAKQPVIAIQLSTIGDASSTSAADWLGRDLGRKEAKWLLGL
jgi:hypothetical protein